MQNDLSPRLQIMFRLVEDFFLKISLNTFKFYLIIFRIVKFFRLFLCNKFKKGRKVEFFKRFYDESYIELKKESKGESRWGREKSSQGFSLKAYFVLFI